MIHPFLKSIVLFLVSLSVVSFQYESNKPHMKFDIDSHDFGIVKNGSTSIYEFKFKNLGKEPLVLTSVYSSCGCIKLEWPKNPVKPSNDGTIKVTFNAVNQIGSFSKSIHISSNAKISTTVLTIKGEVVN